MFRQLLRALFIAASTLGSISALPAEPSHPPADLVIRLFGGQTLGNPPITLDDRVWSMKFSPDGQQLFAITEQVYRIDWRKKIPQVIWQPRPRENETLVRGSFSPDGSMFARLNQGTKVILHDTSTGESLHTLEDRAAGSTAIAWMADQESIAFGGNKEIFIYDTRTGALVRKIPQGQSDIIALAVSPDGKLLVAANASDDKKPGSVLLHHLDRDAPPIALPGNSDRSSEMLFSFSPDSTNLAVQCNVDGRETLYLWDLKEQKIIREQPGFDTGNAITHSPDGSLLAACGLNNLEVRDTLTGREVFRHQQEGINEHYWSVAFSPDGLTLALGIEARIEFFDTRTWQQIDPAPDLRTPVSALAFSSDGRHLVTGTLNGDIVLWDWQTKKALWKNLALPGQWHINAISIDPSNTLICINQYPRQPETHILSIIDFATGKNRNPIHPPKLTDAPILFRADQKSALIATTDHQILHWDLVTDSLIEATPIHFLQSPESNSSFTIHSLSADSADSDLIRWSARNLFGSIHLKSRIETATFDANKAKPPSDTDPIPPRSHGFSNLGSRIWNLPTLHQVINFGENNDPSVRHPGGYLLFTASRTKVRVFDVLSQSIIEEFDFAPGEVKALTLTPDGQTVVAATTGGVHYRSLDTGLLPAGTTSESLWQIMASEDHWQAYLAAWALARQPDFIPFLTQKLTPAVPPTLGELRLLQSLLTDGNHEVRQTAARQLLDLGQTISPETYETLRKNGLPSKLPGYRPMSPVYSEVPPIPVLIPLSEHRRAMRAVMILRENATPAAIAQLKRLAAGHPESPLTIASQQALQMNSR